MSLFPKKVEYPFNCEVDNYSSLIESLFYSVVWPHGNPNRKFINNQQPKKAEDWQYYMNINLLCGRDEQKADEAAKELVHTEQVISFSLKQMRFCGL